MNRFLRLGVVDLCELFEGKHQIETVFFRMLGASL